MLNLEPCIDLEEVELAVAEDELHSSRVDVTGSSRGPPGSVTLTGRPICLAAATAVAGSEIAPLPRVMGTPFSAASLRAASFEPSARIAEAGGPMNLMPQLHTRPETPPSRTGTRSPDGW